MTQSLVDMSPSTVTRLMVRFTQSVSMTCHASAEMSASQTMNESMVAMFGEIMPAPLHMPSSRTSPFFSSKDASASLCTVSVVMIARAVSSGPACPRVPARAGIAASPLGHVELRADDPGGGGQDLVGGHAQMARRQVQGLAAVGAALVAGAGVGLARVDQEPGHLAAVGQHLLALEHRRGLEFIGGEHARGNGGDLADDGAQVELAGLLEGRRGGGQNRYPAGYFHRILRMGFANRHMPYPGIAPAEKRQAVASPRPGGVCPIPWNRSPSPSCSPPSSSPPSSRGLPGWASPPTCLGIMAAYLDMRLAIPLVIIPSLLSNALVMIDAGGFLPILRRFWVLYLGAIPGLAFGLWVLGSGSTDPAAPRARHGHVSLRSLGSLGRHHPPAPEQAPRRGHGPGHRHGQRPHRVPDHAHTCPTSCRWTSPRMSWSRPSTPPSPWPP